MFDLGCDQRRSITPPDACVEFGDAQLSCPASNMFRGRPVSLDSGAYPRIRCRVCGIAHLHPDEDPVAGFWKGPVSWGPNQFNGDISETEIHSYRLYVVDAQYQKIGEPLAIQEVKLWASLRAECCNTEFYQVHLDLRLPENYTYFMVVPVTIAGLELNVGPASERIEDDDGVVAVQAGARRSSPAATAVAAAATMLPLLWSLLPPGTRGALARG